MEHGQLIGTLFRQFIYNVKGKVELFFVLELDAIQDAVFIHSGLYKGRRNRLPVLTGQLGFSAFQHDGIDLALSALSGDHTMRCAGIIIDRVAFVKHLHMVAYLHLHSAFYHDVKLLAHMGGELDGHVLFCLRIGHGDKEGLGGLILEQGSHIQIFKALPPGNGQAIALSGNGIAGKSRADAFDQIGGVDAKTLGALVNKRKTEILFPGLALLIFLPAHTGTLGHFLF